MGWRKLGCIYRPDGFADWARSHVGPPTPLKLDDDTIRVFAAFLDRDRVGRVGYVDVSAVDPLRILNISPQPVLDIGAPGAFDDNGVTPMSVVADGGVLRLYYTGWQLGVQVRYFLFTGLATSHDRGASFKRHSEVPVLDRNPGEAMRSGACVLGGPPWRMWYVSGSSWIDDGGTKRPTYNIRYVESEDGIAWPGAGRVAIDLAGEQEFGLGRPFVLENGTSGYQMWYSRRLRSVGYRLGYAESSDGLSWTRRDEIVGLDVSESGWDSEMICYASVLETDHGTYLFYNGNNYGETGFGVAVRND